MNKKNLALVTGGDSGEITISLKSAKIIEKNIDKKKYNIYLITIAKGRWIYQAEDGEQDVDKNDFSIRVGGAKVCFDVVFISIHGTPGENGKLQGYFDLLGIPYTTSDVATSALTFNKFFSRQFMSHSPLCALADAVFLRKGDSYNISEIAGRIGFPCFVKPNEGGSSLGITKVMSFNELQPAIDLAFSVDEALLIEAFIEGREITCGVISNKGTLKALPITEIISKNAYFDFEAKYNSSKADEITPAAIPAHVTENCHRVSKELFKYFNCKGLVRFDYILDKNEKLFFLEVNTIPGMTQESIVPQQAEAAGISIKELFSIVIENAFKNI